MVKYFKFIEHIYVYKMANEGKLEQMDVDYSSTVDEKIPECEKLAKVNLFFNIIDVFYMENWLL